MNTKHDWFVRFDTTDRGALTGFSIIEADTERVVETFGPDDLQLAADTALLHNMDQGQPALHGGVS